MRREPDSFRADLDRIRRESGEETARVIGLMANRVESALDDRGRIRNDFEVAKIRTMKFHPGKTDTYIHEPTTGVLVGFLSGTVIADDAALRLLPANIPDHGLCLFTGGSVDQSAIFYYDLGTGTTDFGGAIGATMSLDGNVARTGTDGTDTTINIGASSAGLDVENRAGGPISVTMTILGQN